MDMSSFCHSCSAPLGAPGFQGPKENYCKHCTDENGNVKSREEIQAGIAQWLKMWQPGLDDEKAMTRAEFFMKAMPHWAQ